MTLFYRAIAAVTALEAASFLSFWYPQTSAWLFGLASVAAIVLAIRRLEYGVMFIFGELVIGSFGRELEVAIFGFDVSIRMALWLVVMLVWLTKNFPFLYQGGGKGVVRGTFYHSRLFKPYLALAVILGWGIAWGIIRGNPAGLIFSDVNNYLYFALIFPVYDVLRSSDALRRAGTVIATAMSWLGVKTIALFYIFSHELFSLQDVLYDWSRQSHLAEITNIDPTVILSRIFMQSQIWLVFGVFVSLGVLFMSLRGAQATKQSYWRDIGLLILSLAAIIASFSRSFWLAMAITFVMLVIALAAMREKLKTVGRFIAIAAGTGALAVGLAVIAMRFPIPPSSADPSLIASRAGKFTGESAVSSRYAQIRPLLESIKLHPVLGSGFGTSVTYQSLDPRVLKNHPDGKYATTAFELGWLDMWLEIGLLGVAAYAYLLWRILKLGLRQINRHPDRAYSRAEGSNACLMLGALAGLVAVALTHGVSPYLNHPLGIGIMMLVTRLVDQKQNT